MMSPSCIIFPTEPNLFWGPNVLFDLEQAPKVTGVVIFSNIASWYCRTGHGFDQGSTFNIQQSNVQGSNQGSPPYYDD